MDIKLLIDNKGARYQPVISGDITWQTTRAGAPGQLDFTVLKDDVLNFVEGNPVLLYVENKPIFFGFIFTKKRSADGNIKVTAYDQLRYLKNKDSIVYEGKTASEVITMLANDFGLKTGVIEDTKYKIATRTEKNKTLFDIVQGALDKTLQATKELYVLYDDFGKLSLKKTSSMALDILIDEHSVGDFDYTSSIDSDTYNKIKVVSEKNEVYIAKDSKNINNFGVLQLFESLQEGENGKLKADTLLALHNKKTRRLSIKKVLGDTRVRAGSLVAVSLGLGDINIKNLMLVEHCKHTFSAGEHFMELTVKGGEISG